jgi:predicted Zn-dependent protease
MDILTQLKKQAEQVEILSLQSEKTTVEYEANQLKTCTVAETKGTAVRVIRKGQLGFSASTDDTALDKLAANALESAAYGDKAPFSFPEQQPASTVRTFDQKVAELPIPRLVEIGKEMLDLILPVEPNLRCNISLERAGGAEPALQHLAGTQPGLGKHPQPDRAGRFIPDLPALAGHRDRPHRGGRCAHPV